MRVLQRCLLVVACLVSGASAGAQSFDEGSHEAWAKLVNEAQKAEYGRVLHEFDAYLGAHPGDAIAAVERCRFIDEFADAEDPTFESVFEDADACKKGLEGGPLVESAPVRLYLWERSDFGGKNSTEEGERLLKGERWTPKQRVILHETLSGRYSFAGDELKAGEHALRAVEIDPASSLRTRAVEHLVRMGAKNRAVALIRETPKDGWKPWVLQSSIKTLVELGEPDPARSLVEEHRDVELDPSTRLTLARALVDTGEDDSAQRLVAELTDGKPLPRHYGSDLERDVFAYQLAHGSAAQAADAYRALRDTGLAADAFARQRLALLARDWRVGWAARDLLGLGSLLLALAFFALLPAAVIAPVHYRSAVKQVHGFVPADSPWRLRDAWYALTAMLLSSAVGLYAFDYAGFERVFSELPYLKHYARSMVSDDSLARATLAAELLCLLFLLPLIRRMNASRLLLGQWSVLRSIASGVGLAFALMAANLALKRLTGQLPSGLAFGTNTIRAMQGLYALYGLSGLLAVAALLTPFVEEVIFRGALLGALSRHLRVWAGVLLQAFVFAFLHEDNSAVAFLFAFALVAAWLARRSGGLLAPIALHTTVNTFATLALVGFTQSVNSR